MRRVSPSTPRRRRSFDTWQIIYIDLMTNVMIFFVILWAITQRQESKGLSDTIGTETVKMLNLPGDVLFAPAETQLTGAGRDVIGRLFSDPSGTVLNFDTGGLVKRLLIIHGHTDSDGQKDENFELGYRRALAAYQEIRKHGGEVPDHVVLCTHADNTPSQEVPTLGGLMSLAEQSAIREAKGKNRRITIEDKLVSRAQESAR
jgi:outer membrane protein OmpA-like peptidoglycan-associated protein